MTHKDYIKQNALGFEGDTFLKEKCEAIIKDNQIDWVIETGTYRGASTSHFAKWCERVDTIEINAVNYADARKLLEDFNNVNMHFGNSAEVLDGLLSSDDAQIANIFLFLDAHWEGYNPLLDELRLIAEKGLKPIIAIHDFKVPGSPELGFDTYGDIVYEWDWIASSVERIYGKDGYIIEYNKMAAGARRGVIFIYPA